LKKNELKQTYLLRGRDGKAMKEKIESLDVISQIAQDVEIVAIGDNDDGSSKLFRLTVRVPK
jgi:hypothetical protein